MYSYLAFFHAINRRPYLTLLLLLSGIGIAAAQSQTAEWQQYVSYDMVVKLDDERHELQAELQLEYTNNSPDELTFLLLHIWPQAYSKSDTPLGRQLLRQGRTDFQFAEKSDRGGLDSLDFTINGQAADWSYYEGSVDIVKVVLPQVLAPGESLTLRTPFRVKIPQSYSRLGRVGQTYQLTQWYPKPAVYDQDGWHPMSYLDNGEFYSEFGDFKVRIDLAENYTVGATGVLQTAAERQRLLDLDRATRQWLNTSTELATGFVEQEIPASSAGRKTLEYRAENVHDFAWFADKRFHVLYDTLALEGQAPVEVWSFFTDSQAAWWARSIEYLKASTRFYSEHVGSYPYPAVAAAQSPRSAGGGMEYPMITLIGMEGSEEGLDDVITHEVGHNWFYGIIGSNERDHAWMDEGLNSYYEYRYMRQRYPASGGDTDYDWLSYEYAASLARDQPPATNSEQLSYNNYWISAYTKPQLVLDELERRVGTTALDRAMQDYFNTYKFRHPTPLDLQHSLENSLGQDLSDFFTDYFLSTGRLERPQAEKRTLRLGLIVGQSEPDATRLYWSPLLGYNANDGLMAGLALHNRSLKASSLECGLAPAYGFGSKEIVGTVGLRHRILRPVNNSQQLISHLAFQRFSDREIRGQAYGYDRLSAGLELVFDHPFITERTSSLALRYLSIDQIRPTFFDTTGLISGDRRLHNDIFELSYRRKADRTINPNAYELRLSYRTADEQNIFDEPSLLLELDWRGGYMYEQNKMIHWRLYAGYFLLNDLRDRNTTNDFRLSLVDNASADYRYADYYLGRGQNGWYEQQLELRQGGMRAPIGAAFNFGRSNDYLLALNLDSDLPFAPAGFPLRVFLDAGTYGLSPIQQGQVDAFQWVGGLSLTILEGQVGIYLPLAASPEISDRLAERGGILDRISFRLSLAKLAPWKLIDKQEF